MEAATGATTAAGPMQYADRYNRVENWATNDNAVVNIYAKWTPNPYRVSFNANGGMLWYNDTSTVYFDSPYGALPTPKLANHSFTGWTNNAGDHVTSTTILKQFANHTLYASWYDITANPTTVPDECLAIDGTTTNLVKSPPPVNGIVNLNNLVDSNGAPIALTDIGKMAFAATDYFTFTDLIFPDNYSGVVEEMVCAYNPHLQNVSFGDTPLELGVSAFARCTGLTSVEFPTIVHIGHMAFYGCKSLEMVYFGGAAPTVANFGEYVFAGTGGSNKVLKIYYSDPGAAAAFDALKTNEGYLRGEDGGTVEVIYLP